ncbi:MAG TPA: hypothetical protein PKW98_09170 [Candidatus Wallbacteria bacterium]|nr:MAG: hypothetical protein BWY32_02177 [bacterium ADurb.Bin243]HOD39940.1 hypothetical protein [Candidatus Wallbacteria bacterium]HPG57978.1 hypothetical protein [Candidatus Wallbacteria bacterium]
MKKTKISGIKIFRKKLATLVFLFVIFFATGCIQEKLADKVLPPGSPTQHERWTCTVRAPIGTWKYRIGLNSKLVNNTWVTKEWTISSSVDPLLPVTSAKVDPTYPTPPATGEVAIYGNRTFRFYTDDAKKNLESGEPLLSSSLLFEPFNYNIGKDFFINQMVVRFYLNKAVYEGEYGPITNAAVAGEFNQFGSGGERNRHEFKDDGVWPDKTANDGTWTVEVPVESTYTYKYQFYINPQWDAAAGKWQADSYKAVYDMANAKNEKEDMSGKSIITIK